MPFIAVLTSLKLVQANYVHNAAFTASGHMGMHTTQEFLFAHGMFVFVVLGLAYASIFAFMSSWLKRLGQARILANEERFTARVLIEKSIQLNSIENSL